MQSLRRSMSSLVGMNRVNTISRKHMVQRNSSTSDATDMKALMDLFGRKHTYLRISLTEKCNFRCVYCMPEDGVELTSRDKLPTLDERKRLISLFVKLGVSKLRFTGGEPTLSNQLLPLLKHASSLKSPINNDVLAIESMGITTNGFNLKNNLQSYKDAGLTSVNISLDSLIESKFEKLTRRPGKYLLRVLSSVYNAINIGLKTKINCVLMAGTNDDEVKDFVNLTKNSSLDVRFIEYMPFDGNKWSNDYVMGYRKVLDNLEYGHGMKLTMDKSSKRSSRRQNQSVDTNTVTDTDVQIHRHVHRHAGDNGNFDPNDTTKWYRASTGYTADISNTTATRSASASDTQSASVPTPYEGRVGFITTMTDNFCSSCNRIRLTADGKLKVCLFGDDELNLLNLLRDGSSDSEIINEISNAIKKKEKRLGGEQDAINLVNSKNRSMIMIGG